MLNIPTTQKENYHGQTIGVCITNKTADHGYWPFARNGFKIAMTDFDDVTFEREGIQVNVHFDLNSNAESANILTKKTRIIPRISR